MLAIVFRTICPSLCGTCDSLEVAAWVESNVRCSLFDLCKYWCCRCLSSCNLHSVSLFNRHFMLSRGMPLWIRRLLLASSQHACDPTACLVGAASLTGTITYYATTLKEVDSNHTGSGGSVHSKDTDYGRGASGGLDGSGEGNPTDGDALEGAAATTLPPSVAVEIDAAAAKDATPCTRRVNSCQTCTEVGDACMQCRNAQYLHNGACVPACPAVGFTPKGTGNFNRACLIADPVRHPILFCADVSKFLAIDETIHNSQFTIPHRLLRIC
jgi:hypothetical protein